MLTAVQGVKMVKINITTSRGALRDTVKTHVGVISCVRLWCSFMKSEEMTRMTSLEKQILHCGS